MKEENKGIEDEIKNVNMLCGQIENYVKNSRGKSANKTVLSKLENFSASNKKNLKSSLKKNGKGRTNLSMDDKMLNDINYSTNIKHEVSKVKNSSVDTKNLLKKGNLKNNIDKTKIASISEHVKTKTNFENVLNRFKECEISRVNKINERKKEVESNLVKEVKKVPQINKNSRKIVTSTEDFITRQEKFKEDCEKKKLILREETLKKTQRKFDEEEQILNSHKTKKLDKEEIEKKISTMYEWEAQRKTKLEKLKEREPVYAFKPVINKKSTKMGSSKKADSEGEMIDRLYNQEIIKRKQKQGILEDLYTPTFVPDLSQSHNYKTLETEAKDKSRVKTKSAAGNISSKEYTTVKTQANTSAEKVTLEKSD